MGWLGDLLFGSSDKSSIEEPTGGYVANNWWNDPNVQSKDAESDWDFWTGG